jgi:hypothetical protein
LNVERLHCLIPQMIELFFIFYSLYLREFNEFNECLTLCTAVISGAGSNCRRMFSESYDRCYDKVSFMAAWLLCWPMKLTFICNIVEGKRLTLLSRLIIIIANNYVCRCSDNLVTEHTRKLRSHPNGTCQGNVTKLTGRVIQGGAEKR